MHERLEFIWLEGAVGALPAGPEAERRAEVRQPDESKAVLPDRFFAKRRGGQRCR